VLVDADDGVTYKIVPNKNPEDCSFVSRYICVSCCKQPIPPRIVTETNGSFTNVRIEGSLASTQTVGCIPVTEAKNSFIQADLYNGVAECLRQDRYDLANNLYLLAGVYSRFDAARISDKSAGQASIPWLCPGGLQETGTTLKKVMAVEHRIISVEKPRKPKQTYVNISGITPEFSPTINHVPERKRVIEESKIHYAQPTRPN
jgi:hypothetical protein